MTKPAAPSPTPHDALFKAAFEKPEHAAAEFRALLPPELVRRIDWRTLTLEPGSFVDLELRDRHSDLLFSAKLGGRDAFLYLLFEHQSTVDRFLALRMLSYVVRIWERRLAQAPTLSHLPPILPCVLHHSDAGWTGPRRLSELLDPSPEELPELRGFVAEIGLWLDDISHVDDATLRARALAPFPALALTALRDGRRPGRVLPSLAAWPDAFAAICNAPDGVKALEQLFRYIAMVARDLDLATLQKELGRLAPSAEQRIMESLPPLVQQIIEQYGKPWLEQARDEGLKLGRDQGRDEGLKLGQAETLLRQLAIKFGPLDEATRARVAQADPAMLDRWCERVLTAPTLRDALG